MATIVSFLETNLFFGTINTTDSASTQQNFANPVTVLSTPYLQTFAVNDDDGSVGMKVSQFVDNTGTHNVNMFGVFATKCTSVTFSMKTTDCIANAVLMSWIFA
jgi:hypothetical protein